MRPFLVCIHDATPAYARETRVMIRDLAPLVGRRLAFGVVPDWYGAWPLAAHPDYCRLIRDASEELLLHGYFHRRQRGWGPATLLAGQRRDERPRSRRDATHTRARPARLHRRLRRTGARLPRAGLAARARAVGIAKVMVIVTPIRRLGQHTGLEHVLGFFSLESRAGRKRSAGDVELGLRPLGLARAHRPRDRVAAAVAGSRSPCAGDSSARSGARLLADDPPAHA